MKNLTILILLSVLVLTSCQDDSSILSPNEDISSDELLKGRPILNYDLDSYKLVDDIDLIDEEEDTIIKSDLTKRENNGHEKLRVKARDFSIKHSKVLTINSDKGGKVYLNHKWKNNNNENSILRATLDIPRGAFENELTFEIIFDLENYAVELYPSPFKFNKPILLNLKFENVDLTNFDPEAFVFDYLDGEQENLKYRSIEVDLETNSVVIIGAELNHFSRYGWTRTRGNNK